MNREIYKFLKEVAKKRKGEKGIIYYSDLANEFNLPFENSEDRNKLFELIGEITQFEFDNGRPLLSVVVVHKDDTRMPGDGFFKLACDLEVWDGKEDRLIFFGKELNKTHNYWSNH